MASGKAKVKAVTSGDTITIVGKPSGGPPPEMTLTLASVLAPRLARGPQQPEEEKFAWESREFLRELLIGRTVDFKVLQTMTFSNTTRTFADVSIDGVNVAGQLVGAGWAAVKSNRDGVASSIYPELSTLEVQAKEVKIGMWAGEGAAAVWYGLLTTHTCNASLPPLWIVGNPWKW